MAGKEENRGGRHMMKWIVRIYACPLDVDVKKSVALRVVVLIEVDVCTVVGTGVLCYLTGCCTSACHPFEWV